MYAVVRSGSKQYRVEPGQRVRVEKLAGSVGDAVELGEVLLIGGEGSPRFGTPLVSGAKALGKIVGQGRSAKVMLFKAKRRKNYRRKQGHRQAYTEILVDRIEG
ncbi:MAG TPA: 50S ribosomal protein L21 [Myxococcota bacterium]|jgi:large subunit ribosomal protein L21|nr:50S ribosomal protein L21 [Myxococcota bacterium]